MQLYIWVETRRDGQEYMCSSDKVPNKPDYMSFRIEEKDELYSLTSLEYRHNAVQLRSKLTHIGITSLGEDILFSIIQMLISKYYAKFPNISMADGGKIYYDFTSDFKDPSNFDSEITPKEVLLEKIKFLFGFNNVTIASYSVLGNNKMVGCIAYFIYEKENCYNLFLLSDKNGDVGTYTFGDVGKYTFVFQKQSYPKVRKDIIKIIDESIKGNSFNSDQKKECLKDLDSYFNEDSKKRKLVKIDNKVISEIINEDGCGELLSHAVHHSKLYALGDYAGLIRNLDDFSIYFFNMMIAYFGFEVTYKNNFDNDDLLPLINHY